MEEQSILVADKDTELLKEVADYFADAGYAVETTDSAVHVICNILKKKTPVVLLGSDFDQKVGLPDLLQLLKKCSRHLAVILVSDEASFPVVRSIRHGRICYHAIRPLTPDETNGIRESDFLKLKAA